MIATKKSFSVGLNESFFASVISVRTYDKRTWRIKIKSYLQFIYEVSAVERNLTRRFFHFSPFNFHPDFGLFHLFFV